MTTGFIMTVDVAEEFYRRCLEREAVTELEKIKILDELAREHKVEVFQTELGKASVARRISSIANVYRVTKQDRRGVL